MDFWLLVGVAIATAFSTQGSRPPAHPIAAATDGARDAVLGLVDDDPVAHGAALAERFECARCHESPALAPAPRDRHCVRCHQDILDGRFEAAPDVLADWRRHIVSMRHAPSLAATAGRFRRTWLQGFLREPHDLRPGLAASMPRLRLTASEARALAAWLVPRERPGPAPRGDLTRGRALLEAKGCMTCHRMSGVAPIPAAPLPISLAADALLTGMVLAPDLRHTRERFQPAALVPWLLDPAALKPDTPMPRIPLTAGEANDIAAFLLEAPVVDVPAPPAPGRLPLLERPVGFEEVATRVFRDTCWHCHGQPDETRGDGGPGNTGGFGFPGRALVLADYASVASGSVDDRGRRHSLFVKTADGTPRLVAHLMARHAEVAGHPVPGVLGMPLGLPPLSLEDIQLVESWIAQGRPRQAPTSRAP